MQNDAKPAAPTGAPPSGGAPAVGTGATDFKPVTAGAPELQSGEKLLVEAYAVIWIIAFVFLLFTWRRQRALDRRVQELEAVLARAAAGAPAGKAGR